MCNTNKTEVNQNYPINEQLTESIRLPKETFPLVRKGTITTTDKPSINGRRAKIHYKEFRRSYLCESEFYTLVHVKLDSKSELWLNQAMHLVLRTYGIMAPYKIVTIRTPDAILNLCIAGETLFVVSHVDPPLDFGFGSLLELRKLVTSASVQDQSDECDPKLSSPHPVKEEAA